MKAHPAYPVSDQGAYHHSWKLELPMSFKSYKNLGTALSVCPVCCSGLNGLGEVLSAVSRALAVALSYCFMWEGSDKDEGSCIPGVL